MINCLTDDFQSLKMVQGNFYSFTVQINHLISIIFGKRANPFEIGTPK